MSNYPDRVNAGDRLNPWNQPDVEEKDSWYRITLEIDIVASSEQEADELAKAAVSSKVAMTRPLVIKTEYLEDV